MTEEENLTEDVQEKDPKDKWDIEDKDLKKHLTRKQEIFCRCYVSQEEFFCNGTRSYAKAYGIDIDSNPELYKSVQSCATRLLWNVIINRYINYILELTLSNEWIDKQLAMLCIQNDDKRIKLDAIKEVNKLRWRIIDRTDSTHTIKDITVKLPWEWESEEVKDTEEE